MTWWHYLLLVNFYLVLFFGFYALLLRRETFFQLNRIYLVSAELLSFFIPLIQSNWVKSLFITQQVQQTIYKYSAPVMVYTFAPTINKSAITIGEILNVFYITVTLFLALRLIWQLVIVKRSIQNPAPSAAYSFFKKISLGDNLTNPEVINEHEQVHARQWHSVDVLIIETVMIINWFNPVVYLYRFAVKYIHEFIADRQVLATGADKADYALLLLSQTFDTPTHYLVNPFYNHSILKQRIMMLQKNRSHRIVLIKYGLSAPLFILMLILSSATVNNSKAISHIDSRAATVLQASATDIINGFTDNAKIPNQEQVKAWQNSIENAQKVNTEIEKLTTGNAYTSLERNPQPMNGYDALYQFLGSNIKYPAEMKEKNIQGKVLVQFIVEKDGSLTSIKAVFDPGYGAGTEVERVMALAPKWVPGFQNGQAVRSKITIPFNFTLNGETTDSYSAPISNDKVYVGVEKNPEPMGGIEKFYGFLAENISYPAEMKEKNIQGNVIVQFVVEKDGSLSNIKTVRAITEEAKAEAERVLAMSPKWIPGTQGGKAVRAQFTIPIKFALRRIVQPTDSITNRQTAISK